MRREVFSGRLIKVFVDARGNELVLHPAAVVIAAVDAQGRTALVRVDRPMTGGTLLEAPAGLVDAGETPEQTARRELREECGLEAGRWHQLGGGYSSPGFCDERISLFLATELRSVGGEDPDGSVRERLWLPLEEAIGAVAENLACQAALLLAARRLSPNRG